MTANRVAMRNNRMKRALLSGALASVGFASMALGQAVERHPAPLVFGSATGALTPSGLLNRHDDPTPFGIALRGITLVDAHAHGAGVTAKGTPGVDTALGGTVAQNAGLTAALAKFVGQPLSYALIAQIETEVTQFYRDNGRSLVNVTVPPQEITSGQVQININTYVLDRATVEGAPVQGDFIARQIRVRPGQEVDTNRLLDDVNWLNQNPFRQVSVVFEPGAAPGSTKLTLHVNSTRPWSAYAGINTAGTKDTGEMRVYGGFNLSALPWQDHQLSYQFTGAPESLGHLHLWDTGTDKGYLSHALSYFIPITTASGFRTKLTFGASHISSFAVPGGLFTTGASTSVATMELAFPLPKSTGKLGLVPELYVQGEFDDYQSQPYFFGIPFFSPEKTRLAHGVLGVRAGTTAVLFGKKARGNLDLGLVIGRQDTAGRAAVGYSYVKIAVNQEVFFDRDRSVAFRLIGQRSNDALHPLEQMALGGDGTVRGYPVNGVSGNSAAAVSLEYRAAPVSINAGKTAGKFRPHVFADMGVTGVNGLVAAQHLGSVGVGGQVTFGDNVIATIDLAESLQDAGKTKAHTTSLTFSLTARF